MSDISQSMDVIINIIISTLIYSAPLIIIALGGLYSEKSGIVNIGLEGIATFSAFMAAIGIIYMERILYITGPIALLVGIIFAIVGGLLFGAFHGWMSIYLKVDQIISGTIINIIGLSLALFLTKIIFTGSAQTPYDNSYSIQFLGIPLLVYIIIGIVIASHFYLNKSTFGLRMRACGENPKAAQTAGIDVKKVRMKSVLLSGVFGALGGASLVILISNTFSASTVAGKGFIALAILIFAKWKPLNILFSGILFGFLSSLSVNISIIFKNPISMDSSKIILFLILIIALVCVIYFIKNSMIRILLTIVVYLLAVKLITGLTLGYDEQIPSIYFNVFPYILTIFALAYYAKTATAPKALGSEFVE